MKKILTALISAVLLVCSFGFAAMANDGTVDRWVTTTCYLYDQPDTNSRVLETIPAGSKILAWVEIQRNGFTNAMTTNESGTSGWVVTGYITTTPGTPAPSPTPTPTPTPSPTPLPTGDRSATGGGSLLSLDGSWSLDRNVCMRTRVYSQATTAASTVGTMEAGTPIHIDYVSGGFAHITSPYNGFIVSTYVYGWNVPTNYPVASNWWYQGYDWSEVYNYDYYKANQPDVVKALGTSENALIKHFVEHGMKEGRRGNGSFDPVTYIYNHPDLYKRYGLSDPSIYYKHACGIPF